jgi:AraC-like DNA-binding protein
MRSTTPTRAIVAPAPNFFEAQVLPVHEQLKPWIQSIWVNRPTPLSQNYRFYRCPEVVGHLALIIDLSAPGREGRISPNSARIEISGVQSHLYAVPFPASEVIVLALRPGAARAVGLPARAVANERVELTQLQMSWSRHLAEEVANEACTEQRVKRLCEILARVISRADVGGRDIRRAAALANACSANERAQSLAGRVGYSERQLRRVFLDVFGVNPQELRKIMRINSVLQTLDRSPEWTDTALEHGYCDQSHLIRDFHDRVGTTPEKFVRVLAGSCQLGGAIVMPRRGHSKGERGAD